MKKVRCRLLAAAVAAMLLGAACGGTDEIFPEAGYRDLWIMSGGLEQWIDAGHPTVPCSDPTVTCF